MTDITNNLKKVAKSIPNGVSLIAVSKFHSVQAIKEAYNAGQRIFGESRAQELKEKTTLLPADIQWHFIGHLQTNKVRDVVPIVSMIQSVDSTKLMRAIDIESEKNNKITDILLQLHIAEEETKTGFDVNEVDDAVNFALRLRHLRLRGLMTIATNTDDLTRVKADFEMAKTIYDKLRDRLESIYKKTFDTLSMGMSDDRDIAISCGSTMVRVGSDIFGQREYNR